MADRLRDRPPLARGPTDPVPADPAPTGPAGRPPRQPARSAASAGDATEERSPAPVGGAPRQRPPTPRAESAEAADRATAVAFGRRVAAYRASALGGLGMSQANLAAMTRPRLSQSAISHVEAGTRTPSIETARIIARALGVSVGALMGEDRAAFSADEAEFLAAYRAAPARVREDVSRFLRFCLAEVAAHRRASGRG